MSVIFFSEDELANIVSVYVARAGRICGAEGREDLRERASKTLAGYSRANARAYLERYRQKVKPHSAKTIAFHSALVGISDDDARGTFRLLAYNASEGRDYLTGPVMRGLLEIARVLLQTLDVHDVD
jgi:hypothetical protein